MRGNTRLTLVMTDRLAISNIDSDLSRELNRNVIEDFLCELHKIKYAISENDEKMLKYILIQSTKAFENEITFG